MGIAATVNPQATRPCVSVVGTATPPLISVPSAHGPLFNLKLVVISLARLATAPLLLRQPHSAILEAMTLIIVGQYIFSGRPVRAFACVYLNVILTIYRTRRQSSLSSQDLHFLSGFGGRVVEGWIISYGVCCRWQGVGWRVGRPFNIPWDICIRHSHIGRILENIVVVTNEYQLAMVLRVGICALACTNSSDGGLSTIVYGRTRKVTSGDNLWIGESAQCPLATSSEYHRSSAFPYHCTLTHVDLVLAIASMACCDGKL
ncbi:hypothetical protein BDY19DRAFT_901395 [Irpex rosettiformis]|uniref:Uncharacterized protein n=1 Tax=Irpex rosettiformis TaxID=378272 RepID=A0ACB8UIH7_9APHY|nr:hypothetical protein BDY19DRAFT_901395 [Irpex rosettiformis]